jgi:Tfp pilus assembly protein PilN
MGMINLLSNESKKELKAAHTNVTLIKYFIFLGFSLGFLILVSGGSYWFLSIIKSSNDQSALDQTSTKVAYNSAKKQLAAIENDMVAAKDIMNKQILYSKIIESITSTLPSGTILESLQFDNESIEKPTTISARAKNEAAVTELRNNITQSSQFSNPSVTSSSDNKNPDYPIAVTINIAINRTSE